MEDTLNDTKRSVSPARHPDETYEEYKERMTKINQYIRERLQKGRLFWPSSEFGTLRHGD